jgi:predicted acetyltransferase
MSEPVFRPLPSEYQERFQEIIDYAFYPASGPQEYDDPETLASGPGQRFAVVEDDGLRSICTHHDFTASLRGEWVPVAGLAGVAAMPEYRRQGYVGQLLTESLRKWRGEYPLAGLWPFEAGYYEQFGWTVASKLAEYTCDPGALACCRDAPGTMRAVDPDEWHLLQDVHERYALNHDLTVRRTEDWWRSQVFRTIDDERRYVYALERAGTICGYLGYTVDRDGTRTLEATYSGFTDIEALRGLLGFLSNHDSQVESVTVYRDTSLSLFDVVETPGGIECEIHPGTMLRIVDVRHALETVAYPRGCDGSVTLAVTDDTVNWNDDTFELTVSAGRGDCRRVEAEDPPVRVDIETLTQILVGYHSVDDAHRLGALAVDTEDAETLLASWFPTRPVAPMDNF